MLFKFDLQNDLNVEVKFAVVHNKHAERADLNQTIPANSRKRSIPFAAGDWLACGAVRAGEVRNIFYNEPCSDKLVVLTLP